MYVLCTYVCVLIVKVFVHYIILFFMFVVHHRGFCSWYWVSSRPTSLGHALTLQLWINEGSVEKMFVYGCMCVCYSAGIFIRQK